jgi:hypothetical protein
MRRMEEFRLVFLIFALLCFLAAAAPADQFPTFSCSGVTAKDFRCLATNVGEESVTWTLFSEPAYFASGKSASFPAPREWAVIEMRVQDIRVRAMVRYSSERRHVVFTQYEERE